MTIISEIHTAKMRITLRHLCFCFALVVMGCIVKFGAIETKCPTPQKVQNAPKRCKPEMTRHFPDVICIGVTKCGTGALSHFLDKHPLVHLTSPVETYFFTTYYHQGIGFYLDQMPHGKKGTIIMDKSPTYFWYTDISIKRIKTLLPNVKIVLSLCNPVYRAFSAFVERHKDDVKDVEKFPLLFESKIKTLLPSIRQVLRTKTRSKVIENEFTDPDAAVVWQGLYNLALEHWVSAFTADKILVIDGDKWLSDPGTLIVELQNFLEIPKLINPEDFEKTSNSAFYCLKKSYFDRIGRRKLDGINPCLGSSKGRTRNGKLHMTNETFELLQEFYSEFKYLLPNIFQL